MAEFNNSIVDKKYFIINNPDGTYMHCIYSFIQPPLGFKIGEKDSILEVKNHQISTHNNLSLSQDELQLMIDNNLYYSPDLIERILIIFKKYQIYFFILLITECFVNGIFSYVTWKTRSKSLFIMEEIYNDLNSLEAYLIFYIIFFTNIIINAVFYPLGFYSMMRKNVKYLKFFSKFAIFSTITMVFMTYLSLIYFIAFTLRIVVYAFTKYIIHLLLSIILLPNRTLRSNPITNYQTI